MYFKTLPVQVRDHPLKGFPMPRLLSTFVKHAVLLLTLAPLGALCRAPSPADLLVAVSAIPDRRAGLAVVLGDLPADELVALRSTYGYTVHVFSANPRRVTDLRSQLLSRNQYGPISVTLALGPVLPLTHSTANLVLTLSPPSWLTKGVAVQELARIAAPYGSVLIPRSFARKLPPTTATSAGLLPREISSASFTCYARSYPDNLDEWPQFRHDPALTATSRDRAIGPSTGVRWVQGDLWTGGAKRTVMVLSAHGRVFYLHAPWRYESPADSLWNGFHVEARDAFNGQPLWSARVADATELERPMAAAGRFLFVNMPGGGSAALDGATGAVVRRFDGAGDLSIHQGALVAGVKRNHWTIYDTLTGAALRSFTSGDSVHQSIADKLFASSYNDPAVLMADSSLYRLVVDSARTVIRRERFRTGALDWQSPRGSREVFHSIQRNLLLTLEYTSADRDTGYLRGYDARTGSSLWKYQYTRKKAGAGLFVAAFLRGDTLWTYAMVLQGDTGYYVDDASKARPDTSHPSGLKTNIGYVALDARTGKRLTFDLGPWKDFGRCGPDLATERYILGMDYNIYEVAPGGTTLSKNAGNFARGDCGFSYSPANGLRYNSDNNCMCNSFIQGAIAVASDSIPDLLSRWNEKTPRLTAGVAVEAAVADGIRSDDWPMYRADSERSATNASPVPRNPTVQWRVKFDGPVSAPIASRGLVFVAQPDAATVHAVDKASGARAWSVTVGGRVDSAPTYWRGLVIFGSSDGAVQAVRASDGRLAWRFLAAPIDRRIMVRGQLESMWPVYGTVLVRDSVAYAIAGRHGDADGGMFLYALDARSGNERWRAHISGYADVRSDPRENSIYKGREFGYKAYDVRNDLMSSDGRTLFFSTLGVDLDSHRLLTQMPGRSLLVGQGTFLADNTYPNPAAPGRFEWSIAGRDTGASWRSKGDAENPGGELLAFTGDTIYAIRHSQYLHRWKDWNDKREGYLYAASFSQLVDQKTEKVPFWANQHRLFWVSTEKQGNPRYKALVVGRDAIVVACQPGGGLLGGGQSANVGQVLVFNKDGTKVSTVDLGAEPLFDGLAIAGGSLLASTQSGELVCLR